MTEARECIGKIRHDTSAAAHGHAKARMRSGAAPQAVSVYRCRFCRGWHVGHRPRRRR